MWQHLLHLPLSVSGSVSEWCIVSDFGDSYRICQACELVWKYMAEWKLQANWPSENTRGEVEWKCWPGFHSSPSVWPGGRWECHVPDRNFTVGNVTYVRVGNVTFLIGMSQWKCHVSAQNFHFSKKTKLQCTYLKWFLGCSRELIRKQIEERYDSRGQLLLKSHTEQILNKTKAILTGRWMRSHTKQILNKT